jgi:Big-like domain-containing protein
MNKLSLSVLLLATVVMVACAGGGGGGGGQVTLQSVTVGGSSSAFIGDSPQFTATGHFSDGSTQTLGSATWSSSNTSVATVNTTGQASAVASGTTTITAASGGKSGTLTLTVNPKLMSFTISAGTNPIAAGILKTTSQFTASGTFNDNQTRPISASQVTWSSSNTAAATISNTGGTNGLATGVAAGNTVISAVVNDATLTPTAVNGSNTVTLNVTSANVTAIAISAQANPIGINQTTQFTAIGTFDDATTQNITGIVNWSSSSTIRVTIAGSGLAKGVGLGNSNITAKVGLITSNVVTLTVNVGNVVSLDITPDTAQIASDTNRQFTATATLNDNSTLNVSSTQGISWTSDNTTVATIAPGNGLALGVSPGSANIGASFGGIGGATSALTVTNATITSIAISPANPTLGPGSNQALTATGTFSDATTQTISGAPNTNWSSDNTAVAQVNTSAPGIAKGLVTAISAGTANVTATFNGVSGSTLITVSGATLSGITVAPSATFIAPGQNLQFSATGTYSDGSTQNLTTAVQWTSSSTATATISAGGNASGNNAGQTTITATLGVVSGTSTLTVTAATLQTITVNCTPSTIAQSTFVQCDAIGTFSDTSSRSILGAVNWSSSNGTVATVSNSSASKGVVSAKVAGGATITATLGAVSGNAPITVTNATATSISVTPPTASITLGNQAGFTAIVTFSDSSTQDQSDFVTWRSSDVNVAVINNNGNAVSTGKGVATITATFLGVSDSSTLTVN